MHFAFLLFMLFAVCLTAAFAPAGADEKIHNPIFLIRTNQGDIKVQLFADKAPISTANFSQYAKDGFYNGTIFHRVIPDFMIQGGGFSKSMDQKPTRAPIKNEAQNGLKNTRGTLAMARTGVVDSATAQFFINTVDNSFLNNRGNTPSDFGYAVFGEVIEGMDVVDKIRKVKTGSKGPYQDVPTDAVEILEVKEVK